MFQYYSAIVCYILKCFTIIHKIFYGISQCFQNCFVKFGTSVAFKCLDGFECWAVGDPQFWQDLRLAQIRTIALNLLMQYSTKLTGPRHQAIH